MDNTVSLFREYFKYEDGNIYWIKTAGTRALVGSRAGKRRKDGYYDVGLKGKYYLVHRIIFALNHNYLPETVDHIDHNRENNLISNLREATCSQNSHNSRISRNNSTGVKGIRKTRNNKFEARIAINGTTIQVGTFDTLECAKSAIEIERKKRHGQYACYG